VYVRDLFYRKYCVCFIASSSKSYRFVWRDFFFRDDSDENIIYLSFKEIYVAVSRHSYKRPQIEILLRNQCSLQSSIFFPGTFSPSNRGTCSHSFHSALRCTRWIFHLLLHTVTYYLIPFWISASRFDENYVIVTISLLSKIVFINKNQWKCDR